MEEKKQDEVSKEVEEPKKQKDRYEVCEVIKSTDFAIKDTESGDVLSSNGLNVEILNKLNKIEKLIGE